METGEVSGKTVKEECYICGQLCNPRRMLAHIRSHTNVEINECEICGDRFASKNTLQKHYIAHKTHFVCQHCNKKFVDPERLRSHRCFDSEETYSCEVCGKEFLQKSRLVRHAACHSDEKPFKCEICEKCFRFKGNLTAHASKHIIGEDGQYVRSLLKDKTYKCDVCNKEFPNKRNLDRHNMSHTKERPFVCDICNRGFALKHNMEVHARLHFINEKSFQCEKCNKCFNRKSNLKVHYDMHYRRENGLPPRKTYDGKTHFCDICKKGFISKRNLNQHQVSHTKEKPFTCQFCGQKFSYDSSYRRHLFLHTEGAFRKRVPSDKPKKSKPKVFQTVDGDVDDVKPNVCHVCNSVFANEAELHNHKKSFLQDKKKYKCCKCLQVYKAKKRLREHHKIHDISLAAKPVVCALETTS